MTKGERPLLGCAVTAWLMLIASVSPSAQVDSTQAKSAFLQGMRALHDFEYEEANQAFVEAERIDPQFAMAYWGEAMTYYQTLWRNENVEAARHALGRLATTPAARAARTAGEKEKGLLRAVETLFGEGSPASRHRRYADIMAELSARYPDDPDIVSLYGLALLGTVSRGLIGATGNALDPHGPGGPRAHEGNERLAGLAGSEIQTQVAALLQKVLVSHPQHPGALHYLLHDYDDPEHARLALDAARRYAKIAGGASHALHMPSHIFLQLGMWHDAVLSDRAAYDASSDWVRRKNLGPALRNYHALAWLQYELLQLGRHREAWQALGEIEPVVRAGGALMQGAHDGSHHPLLSDLSSMRARYVIEARRWDVLARERNFGNVDELFAIGVSAARSGNLELARMARQQLADRTKAAEEGDLRPAIAIMEREVAALIDLATGHHEQAIAILRAARDAELQLPPPLGLPEPLKPAPELLGEVLLELDRSGEAVAPFEEALRRNAKRSLSLLGLARATTALHQTDRARDQYRELLDNLDHADADLRELNEARSALEGMRLTKGSATGAIPVVLVGTLSAAVVFAALTVLLIRRLLTPAPLKTPHRAAGSKSKRARR